MAIPFHKEITTIDGLKKTIINDFYVYRWFVYLIAQPLVGTRIKEFEDLAGPVHALRRLKYCCWALGTLVIVLLDRAIATKIFLIWGGVAVSIFFLFRTFQEKRKIIAEIGMRLISRDFNPDEIKKTTLFQIGEFYSREYKILSLVDAIYQLDKIYRMTLLLSFVGVCYIVQLEPWWVRYLGMAVIYFFVRWMVNTPLIYRRIR